jgi:hypothetical protein
MPEKSEWKGVKHHESCCDSALAVLYAAWRIGYRHKGRSQRDKSPAPSFKFQTIANFKKDKIQTKDPLWRPGGRISAIQLS